MPVPFLMSWKDVQHTSNSTSLTQMLFFFTFKIKLRRDKTPLMGTAEIGLSTQQAYSTLICCFLLELNI